MRRFMVPANNVQKRGWQEWNSALLEWQSRGGCLLFGFGCDIEYDSKGVTPHDDADRRITLEGFPIRGGET